MPDLPGRRDIPAAAQIDEVQLRLWVESHLVNYDAFIRDDFDTYFIDRAKAIMRVIEGAMEKTVSDKGSEQTIKQLWGESGGLI